MAYLIIHNMESSIEAEVTVDSVTVEIIKETNNIRCEIKSVLKAMEFYQSQYLQEPQSPPHLYTDCQTIVGILSRRVQLEKKQFLSQRTGLELANADLYRALYQNFDRLEPEIHWIKGHQSGPTVDLKRKYFKLVDQAARRKLREQS